jgi:hypothetical protein
MQITIRATAALGAAALLAALAACDRQPNARSAAAPAASEQTVNVPAAAPSGDPAGTTPVSGKQTDISKEVESTQKPQEGDDHAYSTEAASTPQKADGTDAMQAPERKRQ